MQDWKVNSVQNILIKHKSLSSGLKGKHSQLSYKFAANMNSSLSYFLDSLVSKCGRSC